MADMQLSESDQQSTEQTLSNPKQDYPYGLRVHLDKTSIKKLGLPKLPQVGDVILLDARAKVVSISASQQEGGDSNHSIELQITHLDYEPAKDEGDAAGRLYPSKG